MSGRRRAAALAGALPALGLVAACTVGPDYHRPELAPPAGFSEPHAAQPLNAAALAQWWRGFNDPTLDGLVTRALAGNLDLQTAAARIREARAQEIIAGAAAFPQVDAVGRASREHISKNALPPGFQSLLGGGQKPPSGTTGPGPGTEAQSFGLPGSGISAYQLGFDASWELDIFGGTRRAVEGARARTAAAAWSARDVRVSLVAELANAYLSLRALQQQIAVADAEAARQKGLIDLLESRRQTGLTPGLEVERRRTQLAEAQARSPQLRAEARAQVHAIAILLGQPPETFDALDAQPAALPAAPAVPPGLPSDLLRRRPDLRQAERQLAAANAQIGVTVAERYPKISLTGSAQLVSTMLKTLLQGDSLQTAIAGAVDWAAFDGGRRKGDLAVARAQTDEALIAYRKALLTSLKEVEDALVRIQGDAQREASLRTSLAAAQSATTIARQQRQAGVADLSGVLDAEAAELNARNELVEAAQARAQDTVALYKALGGGWDAAAAGPYQSGITP